MGELYDRGWDAFLQAVELADLDLRALGSVGDVDPCQRDDLAEVGGFNCGSDLSHLRPADTDAIAARGHQPAGDVQADKLAMGMSFTLLDRRAADKVVLLRLQGYGKADPGLERVGLVREFRAGEDQPGLDPDHVQRGEAEGL